MTPSTYDKKPSDNLRGQSAGRPISSKTKKNETVGASYYETKLAEQIFMLQEAQ
jgi:hypothetical protein